MGSSRERPQRNQFASKTADLRPETSDPHLDEALRWPRELELHLIARLADQLHRLVLAGPSPDDLTSGLVAIRGHVVHGVQLVAFLPELSTSTTPI